MTEVKTEARGNKKVLFFVQGSMPTPEDFESAKAFGPGVVFRNASLIDPTGPIEQADECAGAVPDNYTKAFNKRGEVSKFNEYKSEHDKLSGVAHQLSRGAQPSTYDERRSIPREIGERVTQSGHSFEPVKNLPESGWSGGGKSNEGYVAGKDADKNADVTDSSGAKMPVDPAKTTTESGSDDPAKTAAAKAKAGAQK
jgi:hypothetical protein